MIRRTTAARYSRSRKRHGLTLVEVLVSLIILVLSLGAISQLVGVGTDRANDARAQIRGTRLAQSKMAEVEAGLIDVKNGESSGSFEGDDVEWTYKVIPTASGPPNLYTVTVRVTREIKGVPHEVVLSQIVFDPTLQGSAAQAERPVEDDGSGMGMGTTGMGGTTP